MNGCESLSCKRCELRDLENNFNCAQPAQNFFITSTAGEGPSGTRTRDSRVYTRLNPSWEQTQQPSRSAWARECGGEEQEAAGPGGLVDTGWARTGAEADRRAGSGKWGRREQGGCSAGPEVPRSRRVHTRNHRSGAGSARDGHLWVGDGGVRSGESPVGTPAAEGRWGAGTARPEGARDDPCPV